MNKLPIWLLGLATALLALACSEQTPSGLENAPPMLLSSALVVPAASSLQLEARSNAQKIAQFPFPTDPGTVIATQIATQSGTVNPLSVSVSALATFTPQVGPVASVLTTGDATATWVDANEGRVVFSNIGWDIDDVSLGFAGMGGAFSDAFWTYTFTADRTGLFTLDFDVALESGDPFGLSEFKFLWSADAFSVLLPLNTSGTITRDIIEGSTFTVEIDPQAGLSGELGNRAGKMTGTFDWSIITEIAVDIDIKPGSDPNSINCNNENAVITVAILTTDDFDATTVDHTTVTFEGASETHVNKKTGDPRRHEEDVDGDGDTDLVFHFRLGDTDLGCDATEGILTGETFDGVPINGTDAVRMIDQGGGQP